MILANAFSRVASTTFFGAGLGVIPSIAFLARTSHKPGLVDVIIIGASWMLGASVGCLSGIAAVLADAEAQASPLQEAIATGVLVGTCVGSALGFVFANKNTYTTQVVAGGAAGMMVGGTAGFCLELAKSFLESFVENSPTPCLQKSF